MRIYLFCKAPPGFFVFLFSYFVSFSFNSTQPVVINPTVERSGRAGFHTATAVFLTLFFLINCDNTSNMLWKAYFQRNVTFFFFLFQVLRLAPPFPALKFIMLQRLNAPRLISVAARSRCKTAAPVSRIFLLSTKEKKKPCAAVTFYFGRYNVCITRSNCSAIQVLLRDETSAPRLLLQRELRAAVPL